MGGEDEAVETLTLLYGNTAPCTRAAQQRRAATTTQRYFSSWGETSDFLVYVQMPQEVLIAQKCCLVAGEACAPQYKRDMDIMERAQGKATE